MDNRTFTALLALLLASTTLFLYSRVAAVSAGTNVIRVPSDFATIQEAIDAAQNGSTILVSSGVYYEHLIVNKTLTLLGAEKEDTIIYGSGGVDVIAVTADNVLIDGFTVRNSSALTSGILLRHSYNSTVQENIVTANGAWGILLDSSNCNTVTGNIISFTGSLPPGDMATGTGIVLDTSDNNTISENIVTASSISGIDVSASVDNKIFNNVIQNNTRGITIGTSNNNTIFHNNLLNNQEQIVDLAPLPNVNIWSSSGQGNYWDDYGGLDDGSGGRVAGDGVGDTDLPWHGVDRCPMISPVNPVRIFWDNEAFSSSFISNSTVSAFSFLQAGRRIAFGTIGPANTTGYFNLTVPRSLLSGPWMIMIDGTDATSGATIAENQTCTSIYLTYSHSAHSVQIIGTSVVAEYPTICAITFLLFLAVLPTIFIAFQKSRKKPLTRTTSREKASNFWKKNSFKVLDVADQNITEFLEPQLSCGPRQKGRESPRD